MGASDSSAEKTTDQNFQKLPWVKGGYFLVGDAPADQLFTSNEWNEEQQMIRDMLVEFCDVEIFQAMKKRGRELMVTIPEDKEEVKQLLKKAGQMGLCGVTIPETYGGMGLDSLTNALVSEYLSHGFSFATTLGAQTSIGCLPIVYYGNAEQKQKYLPGIASGELIAAYALTEPTAGSDANSGKTSAKLNTEGTHYILNGQKIWITNGGFADVYIVFAKIEDDKNLSAFITERDYEGFTVGSEEKKMGIKGSSTTQIYFEDCLVPEENLLGERGNGFKIALNILNGGRLKAGIGSVGGAKFALGKAVEYAIDRKQFGKSISEFGAIQHKIGEIAMLSFAIEAAGYRTAQMIGLKEEEFKASGMSEAEAKTKAIREFAIEASLIKVKGSELVCTATDEGIQIMGGMGYSSETGMEMGYRDGRIAKIYEGTNEINRLLSVGELAKRGMQTKEINLKGAGKKIPYYLLASLNPFRSTSDRNAIQAMKNTFLIIFGAAGRKMGKKLVDEQEILIILSEMLADAYIAESAAMKVEKLRNNGAVPAADLEIMEKMTKLYIYEALHETRSSAREVVASFATGIQAKLLFGFINRMLAGYRVNPIKTRREIARYAIEKRGYPF